MTREFYGVAGSKRREWPLLKIKTYLQCVFWPRWITTLCAAVFAGLYFTDGNDWGDTPEPNIMGLVCALITISWIVIGPGGFVVSLASYPGSIKRYRERLSESPAGKKKILIEARVREGDGRIIIYEISKSITGYSEQRLQDFDPEEAEHIHEFVEEQRKRVDPNKPEITEAKMLARTINEENV